MEMNQLISSYALELIEPPCVPGAPVWSVKASLQDDITEVLPYLNAELKGAAYDHNSRVLIWETKGQKCAFRPKEIAAAPVETREKGVQTIEELIHIVNQTWERRKKIKPDFKQKKLPTLMEIFKLLPRSNCKECGYASCMGFAADVRTGAANPSQCPKVPEKNRESLLTLIGE